MGTSVLAFQRQVQEAGADPNISAIFVMIDTPGGFVGLLPETAAVLRSVRQVKPIIGHVVSLNASAGYWLTANCTALEATQSALVGSIGVYGLRVSIVRQLDNEGIDVEVFSAGRYKTEGLPVTAVTEDERRASTAHVNETYGDFISDVALGRQVSGASVRSGFGEGRVVSAREALRLGMVDRVATLEESIGRLVTATSSRSLNATYPIAASDDDYQRARLLGDGLPAAKRYAVDDRAVDDNERFERLYRY